jgi:hypothetical protein
MVLLDMIRREWIHAGLRIARLGYYFAAGGRGQWLGMCGGAGKGVNHREHGVSLRKELETRI